MRKIVIFILVLILFTACETKNHQETKVSKQSFSHASQSSAKKEAIFRWRDGNGTIVAKVEKKKIIMPRTKSLVMLVFFTTWCPSCKAEIPELVKIYKKYGKKMDIIGIVLEPDADIASFRKKEDIPFLILNDYAMNEKFAKKVYDMVHAPASMPIPMSLLLKNGKYVIHYIGTAPSEMMEIDIQKALGE